MSSLHVEASGDGPALVLLHGWGLNLRVFDTLAAELAEFRTIRVDLPGHGQSAWNPSAATLALQAREVGAALHAQVERVAVLGWSMGGQIALELAAAAPALVERLVLISATPRFTASDDWHGMTPDVLATFAARLAQDWRRTVSEFLELQVRGSADAGRVIGELQAALLAHGEARPEALVAGLANLAGSDLRALLPGVRQPALVVAGQYDRITPPTASRALAAKLPDARYLEIRRAGHVPFLSHPTELLRATREFLA